MTKPGAGPGQATVAVPPQDRAGRAPPLPPSDVRSGSFVTQLGFRLMTAVSLALMPLALLSYNQSQKFENEAQARWQSSLFGETLLAAAPQIEAISRAQGVAAALALSVPTGIGDTARCTGVLMETLAAEPALTFAGFILPDGKMACSSAGKPFDFGGNDWLAGLLANPKPSMNVNRNGPISGESVLVFTHPVWRTDATGTRGLAGFLSVSLPHRRLEAETARIASGGAMMNKPLALITFDGNGTLLSAVDGQHGTVGLLLPAGRMLAQFIGQKATTFRDRSVGGDERTFAVVPIVPNRLYVLGSWPADLVTGVGFGSSLPLWLFPLAMWLASLLAAWLAAEHQVLRHVRALRRSITAFAGGNRMVESPDLADAPAELRDVGEAYERMMSSVLHDEAALEDSIHQKEVLLREVHHRVKNNLQLIASIMNLQMRKAAHPEARQLVKGLHDRVMSLATVHRELYQTSGLIDVQADELLSSISAQLLRMVSTADRVVESDLSFDAIRLTPDQAVPLSLLLTEAMTNALKHSSQSAPQRMRLRVSLQRAEPGMARLEIINSTAGSGTSPQMPDMESTGLGHQLLAAFAMQLGGELTVGEEGATYAVRLHFPLRALSEGENRHEPG